jgi:hypothetical protein
MNWIETIEIRTKHNSKELLESQLRKILDEIRENGQKRKIRVFSKINLETDYLVLLEDDSVQIAQEGSSLGHQLVSFLKDFGMVNHSVWNEI